MTSYALAATPAGARMSSLPGLKFVGVGLLWLVGGLVVVLSPLVICPSPSFSRLTGGGEAVVRKGDEVAAEVPGPLGERDGHKDEREAGLLVWFVGQGGWVGWWV